MKTHRFRRVQDIQLRELGIFFIVIEHRSHEVVYTAIDAEVAHATRSHVPGPIDHFLAHFCCGRGELKGGVVFAYKLSAMTR